MAKLVKSGEPVTLPKGDGWFYVNKNSVEFCSAPSLTAAADRHYIFRRSLLKKLFASMEAKRRPRRSPGRGNV